MLNVPVIAQTLKSIRLTHINDNIIRTGKITNTRLRVSNESQQISKSISKSNKVSFSYEKKYTLGWWKDVAIVGSVFSITGTLSLKFVQPTLNSLGIQGNFKHGPWTYRAAHLTLSPPSWCATLITIGTLFGKRTYFTQVAKKVMSRFIPSHKMQTLIRTKLPKHLPKLIKH